MIPDARNKDDKCICARKRFHSTTYNVCYLLPSTFPHSSPSLSLSPSRPISFHGSHAFPREKEEEERKKVTNSKKETSFFSTFLRFSTPIFDFRSLFLNAFFEISRFVDERNDVKTIVKSNRIDSIHETTSIPNSPPSFASLFSLFSFVPSTIFFFFFFFYAARHALLSRY